MVQCSVLRAQNPKLCKYLKCEVVYCMLRKAGFPKHIFNVDKITLHLRSQEMMRQDHKALLYIGSFALPAVLLLTVLAVGGFAPFGDKSLLIMDMSGQYVEFYNALKYGDIFFSWSKSLGTNYIGVFAYYVSSPFSLLTLFFSDMDMPLCVLLLSVLKIGFAGLSFSVYGVRRFQLKGVSLLAFSCAYALMGYNMAYSMCLMWLDGVIWLPIVLLGVERIITGDGWGLFWGSLTVSLISNYYISYMLILFTGLYFMARCFEERLSLRFFLRRFLVYMFCGCSAAGTGAILLIPTFLSQFDGKLLGNGVDYGTIYTFAWLDFFRKLLVGGYDSVTNSGAPFVYCSFFVAVLALIFFLLPGISRREKISGSVLLLFMALSMWIAPMDKIWHVFQYPNWFPYRYSFLFSFVLISLACKAFPHFSLCSMRFAPFVLSAAILLNLAANALAVLGGLDSQFGYQDLAAYRQFRQQKAEIVSNIEGFCRVGSAESTDRTLNDALSFDYNGVTHYSSSYLYSVNAWLKSYGLAQNYFWSSGYGSTPLTDAFLGIKYVIADIEPAPDYHMVAGSGGMRLYENPYFSSLAFFVPSGSAQPFSYGSVFQNQNSLFTGLTGLNGLLFETISVQEESFDGYIRLSFISDGRPVYCHFERRANTAALFVNGVLHGYLFTNETDCVQYLGSFDEGMRVTLELESGGSTSGYEICSFDSALFARGAEIMAERSLDITDHSDYGKVTGVVSCASEGALITSIPFASGWTAYVDGKRTEIDSMLDTFITIPLNIGSHEIELRYTPPGLMVGGAISTLTILALILIRYHSKKDGSPQKGFLIHQIIVGKWRKSVNENTVG